MKKHYQIIIVFCCFLIMFINQGLPSTSFNVWQSYLVNVPSVGDGGVSAILLIRTLVSFLSIFAVTAYYRLLDVRYGVALATLLTVAGFACYGLAGSSLPLYCLGSVFTGAGYGLGGVVASTALIGNWFHGDVGTAAGIAGVGSGVAGMLIPVLAAQLIHITDLSFTFLMVAALALALGCVVVIFVRSTPAQIGLVPFTAKAPKKTKGVLARQEAAAQKAEIPAPLPRLQKTLMLIAMMLLGACAISANSYFSVLLSTSGIDVMMTATITAIAGAALTIAKFMSGKLFDVIGTANASLLFFIMLVGGCVLCSLIGFGGIPMAMAGGILFGAGCALSTTGLSVWSIELSSPREQMQNVRDFMVAYAFGGFAFNAVPGPLKMLTGTYQTAFIVFAFASLICLILTLSVLHARSKRSKASSKND